MNNNIDIEAHIQHFFDSNFETLRLEGGHSLAPDVKAAALQQVLLYWRRLNDVATKVTDTEVHLNLPAQHTPKGRTFAIEGVVDIVRENDRVIMYDLKTHPAESIRGNQDLYARQLNVYAYIWQHLRGQGLDETAVISTQFPDTVKEALASGDPLRIDIAVQRWDPVIPIPFDTAHVAATIRDFAGVVDAIEDGAFAPAPVSKLRNRQPGDRTTFAVSVCRNCDARFSCASYRAFAPESRSSAERTFLAHYASVETDTEREDRMVAALDSAPDFAALDAQL